MKLNELFHCNKLCLGLVITLHAKMNGFNVKSLKNGSNLNYSK